MLQMIILNFVYAQQQNNMIAIDPKDLYNQAFFLARQCEAVLAEIDKYESYSSNSKPDETIVDSLLPVLKDLHLQTMKLSCISIRASYSASEKALVTDSYNSMDQQL